MPLLLCLPFAYFYTTRLAKGSFGFHLAFEWLAAAVLAVTVGAAAPLPSLALAGVSYLAFISFYEIGYIANDRFSAARESDGRARGPQDAGLGWVAAWIAVRLGAFAALTVAAGAGGSAQWWGFYVALAAVFAFHNLVTDREVRAFSFVWLAWFRFMAPVFWVVRPEELLGVGLGAAMIYAMFRQFGYLDSKGLLAMPGRKRNAFRLAAFALPLLALPAFATQPHTRGLIVLIGWFAAAGILGSAVRALQTRRLPPAAATPGT